MNTNGTTAEVAAASKFIASCLYGKLPRRRCDLFGEELTKAVNRKFQVNILNAIYPNFPTFFCF